VQSEEETLDFKNDTFSFKVYLKVFAEKHIPLATSSKRMKVDLREY